MFYGEVFKALNKAKVKYVVAGGTAVILHGYKRLTEDLDLIVYLQEDNLDKLFVTLEKIGYMPKVPVTKEQFKSKKERERWKKEKGMIVFSFVQKDPPFRLIDIFVDEPIRFDSVYKNRIKVKVLGVSIPIISISHLLKLKEKAARPVDLEDIVQLKEIKRLLRGMK
ncbi:MAG: hypothetical protein JW847_06080 [Candidatus Omnitrophica bacterium]|nr:hypothetical protein [Candidatus Omnitrophota bacterium]